MLQVDIIIENRISCIRLHLKCGNWVRNVSIARVRKINMRKEIKIKICFFCCETYMQKQNVLENKTGVIYVVSWMSFRICWQGERNYIYYKYSVLPYPCTVFFLVWWAFRKEKGLIDIINKYYNIHMLVFPIFHKIAK